MTGFKIISIVCGLLSLNLVQAQDGSQWVESQLSGMTLEEKVGQLFMVAGYSNRDQAHVNDLEKLVKEEHIGGIIFFQGGPLRQANMTNQLQSQAKLPLMIGIDAEWGLNMRLDSTMKFPKQMSIAAGQDPDDVYMMGQSIAKQCKALGIHVNFAPVVDVNINPKNPVIGIRSFGQDKRMVTQLSKAYMKGMQDEGVLACAKHFPGHGDTEFDSHKTLPVVIATEERIDSVELYPYKELIKDGLRSVMAAHLHLPALRTENGTASSLSPEIINGLLREKMGFDHLVFTDALNMKGVSNYYETGELELLALKAGNDVLLFSEDVIKAKAYLLAAIADGRLDLSTVETACRRILKEKYRLGLNKPQEKINLSALKSQLNSREDLLLKRQLVESSITLLKNTNDLLPFRRLDTLSIAAVSIGADNDNAFLTGLDRYAKVDKYSISKKPSDSEREALMESLKDNDVVIIGVHANSVSSAKNYGITPQVIRTVRDIKMGHTTVVNVFANPYSLEKFYGLKDVDVVLMSYEDNELTRDISSQAIFGGIGLCGNLPVDASVWFKYGAGIDTEPLRFKYTLPEELGMDIKDFEKIDKLMNNGIKEGAYPGGQLFIAKDGKVIHNKAYGYHTYANKRPVREDDLYDLASVTKIAATTATVMKLTDEGKISVDSTLGTYLPDLTEGTAYEKVVLKQMMTHQAGFHSWLPFFRRTMTGNEWKPGLYHKSKTSDTLVQVADSLYLGQYWRSYILQRIMKEPISYRKKYKYSDFGFYMLHRISENIVEMPFEKYVDSIFYRSLGMSSMTYKPLEKFSKSRITPTELDTTFRKQLVHGHVHDQGAAMMGGVSGHAGLFSNANDLGIMMQMFLNKGSYAGVKYIEPETVEKFTSVQFKSNGNRRGIGFDKPVLSGTSGPTCLDAPKSSYGHTGFTGITAWADPDNGLIYIFMSNRVYPIADNKKILRLNVRTDIQQVIYDSIKKAKADDVN